MQARDPHAKRQLARAVVASTIGSSIEWCGIVIYALLIPLGMGRAFFPPGDPVAIALAGQFPLLVSFGMRPVGGLLFGHFGDRVGRKAMLVATLLLMGFASLVVGLLPTYAQIGIAATVLLFVLRIAEGLSVGGEWGGAVLLTLEWSGDSRRGLRAAWPQVGVPAGILLGFLMIAASAALVGTGTDLFWRLPFLACAGLVVVGLWVRLGVLETPAFTALLESHRIERAPALTVLRRQWREVLLVAMLRLGEQAPAVVFTTVFLVYSTAVLHVPQGTVIKIAIIAAVAGIVATPLAGRISDTIGRRVTFVLGLSAMFLYAIPYWLLVGTRDPGTMLVASIVAQVIVATMSGSNAAFIAEAFTGRLRYSGASVGAGLGAFFAGGLASIISLGLLTLTRSTIPIGIYLMAMCVVSFVAALKLRERSRQDISREYDEAPVPLAPRGATIAGA